MGMDIGLIIKRARKAAKLSQEQLAEACGYPSQSRISGYETGEREPSFADLEKIARALGLGSASALLGNPPGVTESASNYMPNLVKVPLISWVAAGNWCMAEDAYQPGDAEEWLDCPFPKSDRAFCLRVIGDSMAPDYREEEIILVDPSIPPKHGDDVIARTPDNTYTFKRLQITPDGTYLLALNPDHPNRKIQIPPDSYICGVITGSWLKRR